MNWEELQSLGWEKGQDPRTGKVVYIRPMSKGKRTRIKQARDLKPEENNLKDILFPKRKNR